MTAPDPADPAPARILATGPLAGLRVLVPRSPGRAGPLLDALRQAGAEPVAFPLGTIGDPVDPRPMDDAAARLAAGGFDWVAVTSSITIEHLDAAGRRAGRTLAGLIRAGRSARPGSTRVAAVGSATAAALEHAGVRADFVPATEQSARGMLAEWPGAPGTHVLLPQSDLAEPTLAAGLAARGASAHPVVAYTNSPAPLPRALARDLVTGRVGAVVLTSASVARCLAGQVALPPATVVCSIGPRTAEVAAELGLPTTSIATHPAPEAIVAALVAAVTTHRTDQNPRRSP